jgi:hypothetical protein
VTELIIGELPNDVDGDGFATSQNDCDDTDPSINPEASEVCENGIDEDCDGLTDCNDEVCAADPACSASSEPENFRVTTDAGASRHVRSDFNCPQVVAETFVHNSTDETVILTAQTDFPLTVVGVSSIDQTLLPLTATRLVVRFADCNCEALVSGTVDGEVSLIFTPEGASDPTVTITEPIEVVVVGTAADCP